MNIGFYKRWLNERGDTVALYDYAYFNKKILNNKSFIITQRSHEHQARYKFEKEFGEIYYVDDVSQVKDICKKHNITHVYVPKYGKLDGLCDVGDAKLLVHCVFDSTTPHGHKCAVVGNTINKIFGTNLPVLGHIVYLPEHSEDMRDDLNITPESTVFGRYGGIDSFDIPFVYEVIKFFLSKINNVYFIFMNTNKFYEHPNIIYLEGTTDLYQKRKFINTTDALLHARGRGETFGLTCGEFAICKKPVITFGRSFETEHIDILGDKCIKYNNPQELLDILVNFKKNEFNMDNNGYMEYTPEKIMEKFKMLFFL